jgi:hypothetical protein
MSLDIKQQNNPLSYDKVNFPDKLLSLTSDNSIELSISLIIEEIIKRNKQHPLYKKFLKKQNKSIFNTNKIPRISILEYLHRINQFSEIERSTLICTLIYLDRITKTNSIMLTEYNVHKLLSMSIIVSIKYNEDVNFYNDYYSTITGFNLKEFNKIEAEYVCGINFNFFIKDDEFQTYKKYLHNYCYKKKC